MTKDRRIVMASSSMVVVDVVGAVKRLPSISIVGKRMRHSFRRLVRLAVDCCCYGSVGCSRPYRHYYRRHYRHSQKQNLNVPKSLAAKKKKKVTADHLSPLAVIHRFPMEKK